MRTLAIPVLLQVLLAAPAVAAEAPAEAERPPVRLEMGEVEIRGEVERPEVFYIIPRRQVELDLGPRSKDYREEILTPLLPAAFEERVGAGRGR